MDLSKRCRSETPPRRGLLVDPRLRGISLSPQKEHQPIASKDLAVVSAIRKYSAVSLAINVAYTAQIVTQKYAVLSQTGA